MDAKRPLREKRSGLCRRSLCGFWLIQCFYFLNGKIRIPGDRLIRKSIRKHRLCAFNRLCVACLACRLFGGLRSHLFHCSAHCCHSLRIFFKIAHPLCQNGITHIIRVCTREIVHQPAQRRLIFDLRVHIDNMCFIAKRLAGFLNDAVDVINRQAPLQYIPFRNKNHIGFIQCVVGVARFCQVRVEQAAVVPCTLGSCTSVAALYFDIVDLIALINGQNVQPDRTAL